MNNEEPVIKSVKEDKQEKWKLKMTKKIVNDSWIEFEKLD